MMTVTEADWQAIQQELETLRTQLAQALAQVATLTQELAATQQRIGELEAQKPPPPAFVKANKPEQLKTPRKQRGAEHNRSRRHETPTQVMVHPIAQCPECCGQLSGIHIGRRRQVIELAPPPPVEVIEHQVQRGWCSYCRKWREAPLDVRGQALGQGRLGVRLAATIATMRIALRLPIRLIQLWLAKQHQLRVSVGAIVDVLRRTSQHLQPLAHQVRDRIRASPAAFGDETSWRENGQNGYVWAVGTPEGERYFERHASRAGAVINTLLGEDFDGVFSTDFYGGYNDIPGGKHQRCWVHLLRDLHALKDNFPQRDDVLTWAQAVRQVYVDALAARGLTDAERQTQRAQGEHQIQILGQQYGDVAGHPCRTLAKRLLRHQGELLVFLTVPGVAPDNNAAERQVRPLVVARKISGGSRSARGSQTRMILTSLLATAQAKGHNGFNEFLQLLQCPLPQL
jgi:transposase